MLTPGFTSIMISWMQPRYSPSNYIVSYSCQLLCDTTSIMTNGSVTVESTLTNIFSSLAPGSCCTISVVAVYDGIGMSNTVSSFTSTLSLGINDNYELISTSFSAPNSAPEGLNNLSVEKKSLTVQWGIASCPDQRGPITGYRLRYSNGTSIVAIEGNEQNDRQHMLTGLTPFTSYSVQVAAVNAGGIGPYSTALTVETLQDSE